MPATDSADTPPSAISSQLRYVLAQVCKGLLSIKEIDGLFILSGADSDWWTEPKHQSSSSRETRVNGWLEGIRVTAPGAEVEIVAQVCQKLLVHDLLPTPHRDAVERVLSVLPGQPVPAGSNLGRYNLHPKVVGAVGTLFDDGHYRQAVLDTCIALCGAVQEKARRSDLDGTALMQYAFSVKSPVLVLSEDPGEQQGNLGLFHGAIAAIRNPRAHALDDNDPSVADETLELLAFLSTLFRRLDRVAMETNGGE